MIEPCASPSAPVRFLAALLERGEITPAEQSLLQQNLYRRCGRPTGRVSRWPIRSCSTVLAGMRMA